MPVGYPQGKPAVGAYPYWEATRICDKGVNLEKVLSTMAEANNESQSSANTGTSTSLLDLAHAAPAQALDDSQGTADDAGDSESSREHRRGPVPKPSPPRRLLDRRSRSSTPRAKNTPSPSHRGPGSLLSRGQSGPGPERTRSRSTDRGTPANSLPVSSPEVGGIDLRASAPSLEYGTPRSAVQLSSQGEIVRERAMTAAVPDYLIAEERVMRQQMEMELMSLERSRLIWTVESKDEQVHHMQEVLAELRQEDVGQEMRIQELDRWNRNLASLAEHMNVKYQQEMMTGIQRTKIGCLGGRC